MSKDNLPAVLGDRGEFRVPLRTLVAMDYKALKKGEQAVLDYLEAHPELVAYIWDDYQTNEKVIRWEPRP